MRDDPTDPTPAPPAPPAPHPHPTPEPPPLDPAPPPEPAPSKHSASESSEAIMRSLVQTVERQQTADAELRRLVQESLGLQFKRLDQLAQIQETALRELVPVVTELRTTMELMQTVIAESDDATENLAKTTAALIRLYEGMTSWLAEVKARDAAAEHPPADEQEQQSQ